MSAADRRVERERWTRLVALAEQYVAIEREIAELLPHVGGHMTWRGEQLWDRALSVARGEDTDSERGAR